jgi:hypothetical protein
MMVASVPRTLGFEPEKTARGREVAVSLCRQGLMARRQGPSPSAFSVNYWLADIPRFVTTSPSRTRTYNLAVNSRLLYRLSYRGKSRLACRQPLSDNNLATRRLVSSCRRPHRRQPLPPPRPPTLRMAVRPHQRAPVPDIGGPRCASPRPPPEKPLGGSAHRGERSLRGRRGIPGSQVGPTASSHVRIIRGGRFGGTRTRPSPWPACRRFPVRDRRGNLSGLQSGPVPR